MHVHHLPNHIMLQCYLLASRLTTSQLLHYLAGQVKVRPAIQVTVRAAGLPVTRPANLALADIIVLTCSTTGKYYKFLPACSLI